MGACSSPTPETKTDSTADSGVPGFGSETGNDAGQKGPFVRTVTGRFLDAMGKPPEAGFGASVCGPVCYIAQTGADGGFSVPIGAALDLPEFSALPHGRPYVAGFYFALPVDATGPSIDLGDLHLVAMPHDGAPIDLTGAAPQTLASGPVELSIDAGITTTLEFDDLDAGDAGSQFRAVTVDASLMGRFVPDGVSAIIALGPFESYELDGSGNVVPARLRFDNVGHLDSGAAVDVLALGTYLHPDWIPPARFTQVATGHVSSDGSRIELDSGSDSGILYLTWVAIRERQAT